MYSKTSTLLFLAIVFISGCKASHLDIFPELSNPDLSSKKIEPAQLREDVDVFISGILARHPDASRYTDVDMILDHADRLKSRLTVPMTRETFFKEIGSLSHLFNDGHTFLLWPYQEYQELKEKKAITFPFALDVFEKGVFLKYAYRLNGVSLPKGSRLIRINNIGVDEIFSRAQQFVGGETDILRRHTVANRFPMMLWAVYGFIGQYEVELNINGEIRHVNIDSDNGWQQESTLSANESADFNYYLLNDYTGYLKVATFDVSPDYFEQFIDKTFLKINQQNVRHLIIDIRENSGGNTDTATYLARHLATSPFQMISSLRERLNEDNRGLFNYRGGIGEVLTEDWDEWLTPVDPERRFKGSAYVLISPLSYSSAIVFATAVKDNNMVTLVGRETGGYANQTAQGNLFNLPNSELRAYVATRLLVRPNGNLQVNGVEPDIKVFATKAQIKAGKDADILAALEHAGKLQK